MHPIFQLCVWSLRLWGDKFNYVDENYLYVDCGVCVC